MIPNSKLTVKWIQRGVFLTFAGVILGMMCSINTQSHSLGNKPIQVAEGLASPVGMVFAQDGSLFISNWSANRVDKWKDGQLTTWITDVAAPTGLAIDDKGRLYVASYSSGEILRFDRENNVETFVDGLSVVAGVAFDRDGNLLVCERGKSRVLRITPDKEKIVLVEQELRTPVGVVDIGSGRFVIADISGYIAMFDDNADTLTILTEEPVAPAVGLLFDSSKDVVYSADYGGKGIYRMDLLSHELSVLAEEIASPVALATKDGALYVGSWSSDSLYMVRP